MATLHCAFSNPALRSPYGSSLHGKAVFYEGLAISSEAASGTAITAAQAGNADFVVHLTTDTACYFAIGSTPSATATAKTAETSAKRFLAAGAEFDHPIQPGEKIAVIAA